jgi:hypothetical protein
MSTNPNQSDRATGRTRALRGVLLDRLQEHAPLVSRLERVATIDDGTTAIVPSPMLGKSHRTSEGDPPDVAVAVGLVTGSSDRENRQERKRLIVQIEIELRERALDAQGLAWLDELMDEASAVATAHGDGFRALGASGGTPEPIWDPERGRYVLVSRYDFESWG